MDGRRTIAGLCLLCALLVSALAAPSASAITGTTAFTCIKAEKAASQFTDSHCKTTGEGEYKHEQISGNVTTELSGSSLGGGTFTFNLAGEPIIYAWTNMKASGTVENRIDENGEHYIHGEGTATFTGVTMNVSPKCFVYADEGGARGAKGTVTTEKITGTTTGKGDSVKFEPTNEGKVLARFWMLDVNKKTHEEGGDCTFSTTMIISGSVTSGPNGATHVFTHAGTTAQGTLKVGPEKGGFAGTLTLEGRNPKIEGDPFRPLSPTTVTT